MTFLRPPFGGGVKNGVEDLVDNLPGYEAAAAVCGRWTGWRLGVKVRGQREDPVPPLWAVLLPAMPLKSSPLPPLPSPPPPPPPNPPLSTLGLPPHSFHSGQHSATFKKELKIMSIRRARLWVRRKNTKHTVHKYHVEHERTRAPSTLRCTRKRGGLKTDSKSSKYFWNYQQGRRLQTHWILLKLPTREENCKKKIRKNPRAITKGNTICNAMRPLPHPTIAQRGQNYKTKT